MLRRAYRCSNEDVMKMTNGRADGIQGWDADGDGAGCRHSLCRFEVRAA